MPRVNVAINYISAEKFWDVGKPAPPRVNISTNINIVGVESRKEGLVVPFVTTIGYNPSIAQISIKGQAFVTGDPAELKHIKEGYKKKQKPPLPLMQQITTQSLVEATVVSRSLSIPPPIPVPSPPPERKQDNTRPDYVG